MRWLRPTMSLAILAAMFCLPMAVHACPLCKDAISSSGPGDDEINNAPLAYNQSIYLMAGMPYVLLSFFGFLIYRGCKMNDRLRLCAPTLMGERYAASEMRAKSHSQSPDHVVS